jgi:type I restriction enzyme, S subunit
MEKINDLPKGWEIKELKEVCEVVTGTTPPKADATNYGNDIPFFKPPHLWDSIISETEEMLTKIGASKARVVPPNTVLVTCIGNLGRTGFVNKKAAFNQQINAILENKNLGGRFIFYQAQSPNFKRQLEKLATGTTVSIVNKGNFETIKIVVPPLPEQQAIVAKIEELLSELENGKQQLLTAQQQLKVYRQSLLKWAFEGRFGYAQRPSDAVKEGELPEGWKNDELGNYIESIEAGKSFKCDERTPNHNEIGVLKVSAVTWQIFDEIESKTVLEKDRLNKNYLVKKDDFLFSRANTLDLIGAVVIVNKIERQLMLSDKTLRFKFKPDVLQTYILYYLRSRKGRHEIQRLSTGNQESMRNIGQARIKQIQFPLPPLPEQHYIVSELESKLTICDKIEETISQSLQQAETLRQSILKKAFEGKLVKGVV